MIYSIDFLTGFIMGEINMNININGTVLRTRAILLYSVFSMMVVLHVGTSLKSRPSLLLSL